MRGQFSVLFCAALTVLSCLATENNNVRTPGNNDEGLRQAVDRVIYGLEPSSQASGPITFHGINPAQRLTIAFDADSARLQHPQGNVAFRLVGYGYAKQNGLRTPAPATPVLAGNRLEYRRGEMSEWYKNDAGGVEQGFTLNQRPGVAADGEPLVIALAVDGGLRPELSADGDAVLLESGERAILRYGGLRSWDARGRILPSHLEVSEQQVRLVVEDCDAQYPLVVDPTWLQQQELTASDGVPNDEFGWSVSVSGGIAAVGAPQKNNGTGAVYMFVSNAGVWAQTQELTAMDGAIGDQFGSSVSVSGTTVLIGAPGHVSFGGAAYVYVFTGSVWALQQEIIPADGGGGDQFGFSVSLSGDTALIGAPTKGVGTNANQGAAYVYTRASGVWTLQQRLVASDGGVKDFFGTAVSLSANTALVGSPANKVSGVQTGSAYVFVRSGTTWTQQMKLVASDGAAADQFGNAVSVSGDSAAVGAFNKNSDTGSVYVFQRSGSTWSLQQELISFDGVPGDKYGDAVSIGGQLLVVGAPGKNSNAGAAYTYQLGATSPPWTFTQELIASDTATGDQFGTSVSLYGNTAFVGAPGRIAASTGAAYVFVTLGAVSVTPSSGTGLGPQTFTVTYTDPNGAADIQAVYLDFGGQGAPHTCFVAYVPSTGLLYLYNDTNTSTQTVVPGSNSMVMNSQCTLSGAGGNVTTSGNNLIVPYSITFNPGFMGVKTIYGAAQSYSGASSGWQTLGTWIPQMPPTAVIVTPSNGSGAGPITFNVTYNDTMGGTDLQVVYFNIGGAGTAHSCYVAYVQLSNSLYLYDDTNSTALGPIHPGMGGGPLMNSQCSVSDGGPVMVSGQNLTLPVNVTFKPAFSGTKNMYGLAQSYTGSNSGWQFLGTWTPGPAAPLSVLSVTPINGGGFGPITFNELATDPNGAGDIQVLYLDFGTSISAPNSCIVAYVPFGNALYLYNDASTGLAPGSPIAEGSSNTLTNSQCTLSGIGGTASLAGNNLTVPFNITFKAPFAGSKNVWGLVQTYGGMNSGWTLLGTWNP